MTGLSIEQKVISYVTQHKECKDIQSALSAMVRDGVITQKEADKIKRISTFGYGFRDISDMGITVERSTTHKQIPTEEDVLKEQFKEHLYKEKIENARTNNEKIDAKIEYNQYKYKQAVKNGDKNAKKMAIAEAISLLFDKFDEVTGIHDFKMAIARLIPFDIEESLDKLIEDDDPNSINKMERLWYAVKGLTEDTADEFFSTQGLATMGTIGVAIKGLSKIPKIGKPLATLVAVIFAIQGGGLIVQGAKDISTGESEAEIRQGGEEMGFGAIMVAGTAKNSVKAVKEAKANKVKIEQKPSSPVETGQTSEIINPKFIAKYQQRAIDAGMKLKVENSPLSSDEALVKIIDNDGFTLQEHYVNKLNGKTSTTYDYVKNTDGSIYAHGQDANGKVTEYIKYYDNNNNLTSEIVWHDGKQEYTVRIYDKVGYTYTEHGPFNDINVAKYDVRETLKTNTAKNSKPETKVETPKTQPKTLLEKYGITDAEIRNLKQEYDTDFVKKHGEIPSDTEITKLEEIVKQEKAQKNNNKTNSTQSTKSVEEILESFSFDDFELSPAETELNRLKDLRSAYYNGLLDYRSNLVESKLKTDKFYSDFHTDWEMKNGKIPTVEEISQAHEACPKVKIGTVDTDGPFKGFQLESEDINTPEYQHYQKLLDTRIRYDDAANKSYFEEIKNLKSELFDALCQIFV